MPVKPPKPRRRPFAQLALPDLMALMTSIARESPRANTPAPGLPPAGSDSRVDPFAQLSRPDVGPMSAYAAPDAAATTPVSPMAPGTYAGPWSGAPGAGREPTTSVGPATPKWLEKLIARSKYLEMQQNTQNAVVNSVSGMESAEGAAAGWISKLNKPGENWVILNAQNPKNGNLPGAVNDALHAMLRDHMEANYPGRFVETLGSEGPGKPTDKGFLIFAKDERERGKFLAMQRDMGQSSAMTSRGLHDFETQSIRRPLVGFAGGARQSRFGDPYFTQILDDQGQPVVSFGVDLYNGDAQYVGQPMGAAPPGTIAGLKEADRPLSPAMRAYQAQPLPSKAGTPPAPSEPMLQLSHRSPNLPPAVAEINPAMQGTGPVPGAERNRQAAFPELYLPRSYYNVRGTPAERGFENLPEYVTETPQSSVYDLTTDPQGMRDAAMAQGKEQGVYGPGVHSITEQNIQKAGFKGYQQGNTVAMFDPLTAYQPERLPTVLGASEPRFAYVDPGTFHGTFTKGLEVPTQGQHGVHTGTKAQARDILRMKPQHGGADPLEARMLHLAGRPQNPAIIGRDLGSWYADDLMAELESSGQISPEAAAKYRRRRSLDQFGSQSMQPEGDLHDTNNTQNLNVIQDMLRDEGKDAIVYPNQIEGTGGDMGTSAPTDYMHPRTPLMQNPYATPNPSTIWLRPGEQLRPWTKEAATRGLTIPLEEQRVYGMAGAQLFTPGMTKAGWLKALTLKHPELENILAHQPALGEGMYNVASRYRKTAEGMASPEAINAIAAKSDPLFKSWYRGWATTMKKYFPGQAGELLTRFKLLSAQKSPQEEARQALKALQFFGDLAPEDQHILQKYSVNPAHYKDAANDIAYNLRKHVGTTQPRANALLEAYMGNTYNRGLKIADYQLASRGFRQSGAIDRHVVKAYLGESAPKHISPETYQLIQSRLQSDAAAAGMDVDEFQAMVWGGKTGYKAGFGEPGATVEDWIGHYLTKPEFNRIRELVPESEGLRTRTLLQNGMVSTTRGISEGNAWSRLLNNESGALGKKRETITSPAIRLPDGTIFEGAHHGEAWDKAVAAGKVQEGVHPHYSAGMEGFTTSSGRFVNRPEAGAIAGYQVDPKRPWLGFQSMFSEHLKNESGALGKAPKQTELANSIFDDRFRNGFLKDNIYQTHGTNDPATGLQLPRGVKIIAPQGGVPGGAEGASALLTKDGSVYIGDGHLAAMKRLHADGLTSDDIRSYGNLSLQNGGLSFHPLPLGDADHVRAMKDYYKQRGVGQSQIWGLNDEGKIGGKRTILRVEDQYGQGPYASTKPGAKWDWIEDKTHVLARQPMMTAPEWHNMSWDARNKYSFGFRDVQQLQSWFTPTELKRLDKLGFKVKSFDVKRHIYDASQAVFKDVNRQEVPNSPEVQAILRKVMDRKTSGEMAGRSALPVLGALGGTALGALSLSEILRKRVRPGAKRD